MDLVSPPIYQVSEAETLLASAPTALFTHQPGPLWETPSPPDTTITWAGETFASMGLDQALSTTPLVLFTLDNNETISAVLSTGGSGGVSAIPEPSSLLGLAGLMTASTFLRRRRPRA